MIATAYEPQVRELDSRETDGILVRLLWRPAQDMLLLHVDDAKLGIRFALPVERADAMYAFHHPFAYAEIVPPHEVGHDLMVELEA